MNSQIKTPFGALQVTGRNLTDTKGNEVRLKGISISGIHWYPQYVNKETFAFLQKETGIDTIRLAVYTVENGYCNKDDAGKAQLEELVAQGITAAAELGMYVIVDWHIFFDGNPNIYKEEAKAFFSHISERFADYDNIIYEICNEPNGDIDWQGIKRYAEEVIPCIRQNSPEAIVLVGTPVWSQFVHEPLTAPLSFDNIMYVMHFFAATHTEWLRKLTQNALEGGLPVFVSAFSTCDSPCTGKNNFIEAEKWMDFLDEYRLSYCIGCLSNKNETSALLKPYCKKTTGFDYEDWSEEGQWFLERKEERMLK